jgi:hypothetical protein
MSCLARLAALSGGLLGTFVTDAVTAWKVGPGHRDTRLNRAPGSCRRVVMMYVQVDLIMHVCPPVGVAGPVGGSSIVSRFSLGAFLYAAPGH